MAGSESNHNSLVDALLGALDTHSRSTVMPDAEPVSDEDIYEEMDLLQPEELDSADLIDDRWFVKEGADAEEAIRHNPYVDWPVYYAFVPKEKPDPGTAIVPWKAIQSPDDRMRVIEQIKDLRREEKESRKRQWRSRLKAVVDWLNPSDPTIEERVSYIRTRLASELDPNNTVGQLPCYRINDYEVFNAQERRLEVHKADIDYETLVNLGWEEEARIVGTFADIPEAEEPVSIPKTAFQRLKRKVALQSRKAMVVAAAVATIYGANFLSDSFQAEEPVQQDVVATTASLAMDMPDLAQGLPAPILLDDARNLAGYASPSTEESPTVDEPEEQVVEPGQLSDYDLVRRSIVSFDALSNWDQYNAVDDQGNVLPTHQNIITLLYKMYRTDQGVSDALVDKEIRFYELGNHRSEIVDQEEDSRLLGAVAELITDYMAQQDEQQAPEGLQVPEPDDSHVTAYSQPDTTDWSYMPYPDDDRVEDVIAGLMQDVLPDSCSQSAQATSDAWEYQRYDDDDTAEDMIREISRDVLPRSFARSLRPHDDWTYSRYADDDRAEDVLGELIAEGLSGDIHRPYQV